MCLNPMTLLERADWTFFLTSGFVFHGRQSHTGLERHEVEYLMRELSSFFLGDLFVCSGDLLLIVYYSCSQANKLVKCLIRHKMLIVQSTEKRTTSTVLRCIRTFVIIQEINNLITFVLIV